jgi:hypothetical protein
MEKIMRLLNTVEIECVNGAGWLGELVTDMANADFVGAYEHIVDSVSHAIERVADAVN